MNINNEKLNLNYSFFGYNLYSSSFISSPKREDSQIKTLEIIPNK